MLTDLGKYKDYVRQYYETRDLAHNFDHIERIINTSTKILNYEVSEKIDYALLNFLRCFHGLNKKLQEDRAFRQSSNAFLTQLGWSEIAIENAFESLERHCKCPKKLEEEIIHDANYIEVLGAFGLARAFNSAGTRGQSIEEIAEILKDQYYNKIEYKTQYGKLISEKRKVFAQKFLLELEEEIEWYRK